GTKNERLGLTKSEPTTQSPTLVRSKKYNDFHYGVSNWVIQEVRNIPDGKLKNHSFVMCRTVA
ncbi:hypothetical protein CU098_011410, partial [Rhizopus stolonifer]